MSKWQCPTCNSSSLQVIPDKFLVQHNAATEMYYHEDWFEAPEMIVNTLTTLLSCTNPTCKEVVSCSGSGNIETDDDVFDGYNMLSFVLEKLYDNKHTHVKHLAKKINAKKGI